MMAPLAEEGVLIVGSGRLTHNLDEFRLAGNREPVYAREFVTWVRDTLISGDPLRLQQALKVAPNALRAHPTTDSSSGGPGVVRVRRSYVANAAG